MVNTHNHTHTQINSHNRIKINSNTSELKKKLKRLLKQFLQCRSLINYSFFRISMTKKNIWIQLKSEKLLLIYAKFYWQINYPKKSGNYQRTHYWTMNEREIVAHSDETLATTAEIQFRWRVWNSPGMPECTGRPSTTDWLDTSVAGIAPQLSGFEADVLANCLGKSGRWLG